MRKRTLDDVDVEGKRVLVRVDFNVPIDHGGEGLTSYDHRLKATLPTIQYLSGENSRIVLCSHLGRPKGKPVEELRMGPVGDRLSVLLGRPVMVVNDCVGPEVEEALANISSGDILLLENLRFHPGEEKNDQDFARALANLAEVFVMDAFAVAHRAHASTVGVPKYLPSAAGMLMQREVEIMTKALESPSRPLAAILGGAKVSDKISVLENLLDKVDRLFVGGGMAATFLRAQGHSIGASLVEEGLLDFARRLLQQAENRGVSVHLPEDVIVSREFVADPGEKATVPVDKVPAGWHIMDIGGATIDRFVDGLEACKTVIWNGPMGVFEYPDFAEGTKGIGAALASMEATTIVGGGSTAEAVEKLGLMGKFSHVSTGGGASLEFMEGKNLPGITALPDKDSN